MYMYGLDINQRVVEHTCMGTGQLGLA